MRHARPDFDRIQDPAGKIPRNEPVFLLRGQDKSAPAAVRAWANAHVANGGDPRLAAMAEGQALAMETWQREIAAKVADRPDPANVDPKMVDSREAILDLLQWVRWASQENGTAPYSDFLRVRGHTPYVEGTLVPVNGPDGLTLAVRLTPAGYFILGLAGRHALKMPPSLENA